MAKTRSRYMPKLTVQLMLFILLTCFLIVTKPITALAANQVNFTIGSQQYTVNGQRFNMDVAPYIKNGRTFLPVRYVATALGIPESGIIWDNKERAVKLVTSELEATLFIGKKEMFLKKSQATQSGSFSVVTMDVSPEITNDRTMLPLRWIAEVFGVQVDWEASTSTVYLSTLPDESSDVSNPQLLAVVTGSVVNIRSGPDLTAGIITTVKQGTTLTICGQEGDWYQIIYSGKKGYIAASLVSIQKPVQPSRGSSGSDNGTSTSAIKGKLIVIDPGHGGTDPGAIGVTGLKEKDFNLDVALRLSQLLNRLGAKVVMTRTEDVYIPLEERPAVANKLGADVFVSIHANASTNPQANGTTTYYHVNTTDSLPASLSKASAQLAECVQQALVQTLQLNDQGSKTDPGKGFVVLRESQVPAILIEAAFLSNKSDEALLKKDDFREKVAEGIMTGLIEYFSESRSSK